MFGKCCVVAFRSVVYTIERILSVFMCVRRRWVREWFRSLVGSLGVFVYENKVFDWLWRVKRGVDEMLRNSIGFVCPAKTTRLCVWLSWAGVLVFGKSFVVAFRSVVYTIERILSVFMCAPAVGKGMV